MKNKILNRIIASILNRIGRPFKWIMFYHQRLFHFVLPNLNKIVIREVSYVTFPRCNQKLIVSGVGQVEFGDECKFGYILGGRFYKGVIEIQPRYKESKIKIGNKISTNNNLIICAANYIEIGDDTLIGEGVSIIDHEAHCIAPEKRKELGEIGQVIIGRNVWIGNRVMILKNSKIGNNSIVAAGAVVSGEFPSDVIIGGVPAKIIRHL
jgi:acetyltransferase-like isoleucine patch superfamily enzyme